MYPQAILTLGALGADADLRTALGYTAMHAAASRNNKASILALAQVPLSLLAVYAVTLNPKQQGVNISARAGPSN